MSDRRDEEPISPDVRRLWEHEDHLINHRIGWLMVCQALLFTALPALKDPADAVTSAAREAIPILGLVSSLLVAISVVAASFEIERLASLPDAMSRSALRRLTMYAGLLSTTFIPLAFVGAWLYMLGVVPGGPQ